VKCLISKLFGVNTVQPLGVMTCENDYCGSLYGGTLYEVRPNGDLVKRGCC